MQALCIMPQRTYAGRTVHEGCGAARLLARVHIVPGMHARLSPTNRHPISHHPARALSPAPIPSSLPPARLCAHGHAPQQNLGAVVRSAYCLGAAGVLACARNCAPLSPTVSKASAGALEVVQLHSCRNLPRTLLDAGQKGWAVLGAAAGRDAVPCSSVAVDRPTILVLGTSPASNGG